MFFPYECHTHSNFCDGRLSPEDLVAHAYRMGYKAFGVSVHSPLPFKSGYAMPSENENAYIRKMQALKLRYRGKMDVLMGIEWDYDTHVGFPQYDYRIGSVHQLFSGRKYYALDNTPEELFECIRVMFGGNTDAFLAYYFNAVETSAMRRGVDIVGHFDLPTKYNRGGCFFDENSPRYREFAISALHRIAAKRPDVLFEVNVGGMYRASRPYPYPAPFLLRELALLKARITLTSDAHDASGLAYQESAILSLCRNSGHRAVYGLSSKGLVEVAL